MTGYYSKAKKQEPHSYKRIQSELSEGSLKHILLFYGRERYLIRWACGRVKETYVRPESEFFDFVKIDGTAAETEEIIGACETVPMLSEKKVVLVEDFDETEGRGDRLAEYMKEFPESSVLILVCDSQNKKKKLYKAAVKYGSAYDFDRLSAPLLRSFLAKRFRAAKKAFDPDLAGLFIDLSGYYDRDSDYTLDNLVNDAAKVTALSGERITAEDIENAVAGNISRDVFAFSDALTSGRRGEALRMLHSLMEYGENIFKLLGLICAQYETILAVSEMRAEGMTLPQMKSILGIHEYRIRKALGPASSCGADGIRRTLMKAYEAERNIKTGAADPQTALELFVAEA